MNKKESNIQTAFILAIVAQSILLLFVIIPGYISVPSDALTKGIMLLMYYPAPMILGIIASSMNRVTSLEDVGSKFKVYRIVTKILSPIAIVISAVITFVYLIVFTFGF